MEVCSLKRHKFYGRASVFALGCKAGSIAAFRAGRISTPSEIEYILTSLRGSENTDKRFRKKRKEKKNPTSLIMNNLSISNSFYSNNRENAKSDLWGLDLLTPVFHCGNGSSNCFWGVPNPFTLHSASPSRKHDWYLTHVLFSSPFMSAQSLWWCLFAAHIAFEFGSAPGRQIDLKDGYYFLFPICGFLHAWSALLCAVVTL